MTERELEQVVEKVAGRVADLLAERVPEAWLDAQAVARLVGCEAEFVYSNTALRRAARRLGDGPKARLRWRREDVEAAFPTCSSSRGPASATNGTVAPPARRSVTALGGTRAELLPIRGQRRPNRA